MQPEAKGLQVRGLSARYGVLTVCRNIDLSIAPGEVVGLVGPNGAGKTSLIGAIAGVVASDGAVQLDGADLSRSPGHRRASLGLATVPDNRGLFPTMTVGDNVRLGSQLVRKADRADSIEAAVAPFAFLRTRWETLAGSLSGGEQQMLAVAKCLAGRPRAILLDEPSQGLAPIIVDQMVGVIDTVRKAGLPVLLAEQNHGLVQNAAQRFLILLGGRIVFSGPIADFADRDRIARLFLQHKQEAA